jgi:NDP-sugar pyrophosphorylase family protein
VYREVLASSGRSSTEPGTKIARSTQILSDTIVGANVQIGERCTVQGTVIGNYCEIGHDVKLKDCHLWEKVCIFDNVSIEGCILCEGVVIRSGVTLGTGCVIGKGCIIGENVLVPPFTRITLCAKDDEGDGYDDAFSSSKGSSTKEDDNEEEDIVEDENEDESDDEIIRFHGTL